jgi:predicted kinase
MSEEVTPKKLITVRELEAKILEREEIVVVIRAPATTQVEDYSYERKAAGNTTVTDYIDGRLKPCLGGHEFTIINGDHTNPHGRTKLSTLRDSYEK